MNTIPNYKIRFTSRKKIKSGIGIKVYNFESDAYNKRSDLCSLRQVEHTWNPYSVVVSLNNITIYILPFSHLITFPFILIALKYLFPLEKTIQYISYSFTSGADLWLK